MVSFTDVFGGQNKSPAQLDYNSLTMTADVQLTWPFQTGVAGATYAAHKIDILSTTASLSILMPNATLVSPGQDLSFNNVSANTVTIKDFTGATLGTVAAGTSWMFYVRDNSTTAGLWRQYQLGAGTSTATAGPLAGFGLFAQANTLNQQALTVSKASTYNLTASDRAGTTISTGGALSFTFDPASTLTNGWFNFVRNAGSGTLTLDPSGAELIDGTATKALGIGESCIVLSTGTALITVGYGRQLTSTVSAITIDINGTGNYTLNATELAAQVQNYIGLLTGARSVIIGAGAGYWFVWNNTTGAFTTTWKVSGADPGAVVPQGSFSIIRSDGSNAKVAFTATSGTVTQVNTGVDLTGGPITTTGTIDHVNSGVTPGTYGSATKFVTIVVNARGHITSLVEAADAGTIFSTGMVVDYISSTPPTGWVSAFGTIGSGASAATNRANADTATLYTMYWTNYADAQAPVSGGRGASAAADFAANKTIAVSDMRGRGRAGLDNIGGASASRLTATTMTPNGTTFGAINSGTQTATAATTINSSGSNSIVVNGTASGYLGGTLSFAGGGGSILNQDVTLGVSASAANTINVSGSGTSSAFGIVQPTMLFNVILKL